MAYHVFISYRREGASELALLLYNRLSADGYQPFLDMEGMRSGMFNTQLFERMDECSDVVLLLPENAFNRSTGEEDWLRLEITHALKTGKNIVPVFMRNFKWPSELTSDLDNLRYRQGVEANIEYFDAVYEKLCQLITYKPQKKKTLLLAGVAMLVVAVAAFFLRGWITSVSSPVQNDTNVPAAEIAITSAKTSIPLPTSTSTPTPTPTPTSTPVLQMEYDDLTLKLGDGGEWVVSQYNGNDITVVIPVAVDGIAITEIGDRAFYGCSSLKRVVLSAGLIAIGDEAFSECEKLQEIILPEGIESIGKKAFYKCPELKTIMLPKSLLRIGKEAFYRAEETYTMSWWFTRELPIEIYVIRNSYAANYVQAYHSHDLVRYYKPSVNNSVVEIENYSDYGAKLKSAKIQWVKKSDLKTDISYTKASSSECKEISRDEYVKKTDNYRFDCFVNVIYSEPTYKQKIDMMWVLRSPSGRIACEQSEFQMESGWNSTWHYHSLYNMMRDVNKGFPPNETGTYTVELYFDSQFVGSASFVLKE